MEHGMLGQNGTLGQNRTGQNGTIPFCPQRCFILPQCTGPFYPTPIPPTKISVLKVIKRFWEEEVNSFRPSGEFLPVNWVIIGLNNDLSPVKRHIIILIDAHAFPFVHIENRYKDFLSTCKGFHHIKISPVNVMANEVNRHYLSAVVNWYAEHN